jgi:hypothetical protein
LNVFAFKPERQIGHLAYCWASAPNACFLAG